jgi:type VI secretion system secreted protein VgrG
LKSGKNIVIEATDSITLKCGSATISMKSDGKIMIDGSDISSTGSGKINVKASNDVIINGSAVKLN